MKWLMAWFVVVSFSVKAEVAPEHVESMLQQMVRENVISPVEAEKTKLRIRGMNSDQWTAINKKAAVLAQRLPASFTASNNRIEEVNGIDLDGAQFKEIQDEMKKIVPDYKNLDQ
jgi:hypothetical protein